MMMDKVINAILKFIFIGALKIIVKFVKFVIFLVLSGALVAFLFTIYNVLKFVIGGIIKLITGKGRGAVANEI